MPAASSSLPGSGAGHPERSPIWPCSGWGFHGRPVTRTPVRSYRTISPLPPRRAEGWRYVSVALSVGSRRPAVSRHPARWSSDFPPAGTRGCPPAAVRPPDAFSLAPLWLEARRRWTAPREQVTRPPAPSVRGASPTCSCEEGSRLPRCSPTALWWHGMAASGPSRARGLAPLRRRWSIRAATRTAVPPSPLLGAGSAHHERMKARVVRLRFASLTTNG